MNNDIGIYFIWCVFFLFVVTGFIFFAMGIYCSVKFGFERIPEVIAPKDNTPVGIYKLRRIVFIVFAVDVVAFVIASATVI